MTIQQPPGTSTHHRIPTRTKLLLGASLGLVLLAAGALGIALDSPEGSQDSTANAVVAAQTAGFAGRIGGGSLAETIDQLEQRVDAVPGDDLALATLGIAYVQQAHATGDPTLLARAETVLDQSLNVNGNDNFVAYTGLAALAAGRHDFVTAEAFARQGLDINPSSAALHGVLSDAQIQLGQYDDGFASVQRMVDLSPDTASLARVSYTHELRGDNDEARLLMQRALEAAASPDDEAFALFQLGELSLGEGDADTALALFNRALAVSPRNISALSGKAHALGVLGQTQTSIDSYRELIDRAPLPDYVIEFADFLDAHEHGDDAAVLYEQAADQLAVDAANGIRADAGIVFFEADHGDPERALRDAEAAIDERPFFETYEAYAWALYVNDRYGEAAAAIEQAKLIGIRDAEMFVRSAVIHDALGDREAALVELRTARSIDADASIPQAAELIAILERSN
jgi:tetratricopeptide (TPR) repeat protein